ncbi:MAG: hypothetical protein OXH99_18760 [Bryobacterales bacterium]|nr:hypothetical protein [Bryobacterales bacterium]
MAAADEDSGENVAFGIAVAVATVRVVEVAESIRTVPQEPDEVSLSLELKVADEGHVFNLPQGRFQSMVWGAIASWSPDWT